MPKASDLTPETRFVGLFVGQSGSGKTVAAASFPSPIHINDFDGRIRGLLGAPWIDRSKITYDYFPPKSDGLIPELNKKLEVFSIQARTGQLDVKTHITDSITNECYAFICQAISMTHGTDKDRKGKWIGPVSMAGPEDYGLESQAASDYMAFIKSIPIPNIIVSAHLIDKFGKPLDFQGREMTYAESIVVGEKLSIRDKIGVNIQTHFDHIFKFERETINGCDKYYVTFKGGIARTSYSGLPEGRWDITGKSFYEEMQNLLKKEVLSVAS
jgi:hypothetical protein